MGKRKKASKPQGPKKRELLPTTFQCLFCNHENSVTVKIDKKLLIGTLTCKVCAQTFQANTNYLTEAIDVYSEWVDACDAVAKGKSTRADDDLPSHSYQGTSTLAKARAAAQEEDDVGDFIEDDEGDMEGTFRG